MNLSPAQQRLSNAASVPIILPDELITELLSFLPVKSLMPMNCVCKSWRTLISDSSFTKLQLQRSTRNPQLAVTRVVYNYTERTLDAYVSPISLSHFLENLSKPITLTNDPYYCLNEDSHSVVGSCNGLLCLYGYSDKSREMWLRFWNPATRTISDKLGHYPDVVTRYYYMSFGYDNSTDTYKVVILHRGARVFSLDDNVWRNIHRFPISYYLNDGVHFRGSVNWLAIDNYIFDNYDEEDYYDCEYITTIKQFKIVSVDLGTETYKKFLPPRGFVQVPYTEPSLCVLMDCLCFSHVVEQTHFVLWKMTDYGVEESWTQLIKINFQIMKKFHHEGVPWVPLHLSNNYDTLLLENNLEDIPVVYNLRDGSVERIRIANGQCYRLYINDYVESLVLCH